MKRATKEKNACQWTTLRMGRDTVRVLDVSDLEGRRGRWPEVLLLEVSQGARKKLFDSPGALLKFVNQKKLFSQPARKLGACAHSMSGEQPGQPTVWVYILVHAKTSMFTAAGTGV